MEWCCEQDVVEFHACSHACCVIRLKANNANVTLDLFYNNELIDPNEDRKLLSVVGIKDKTVTQTSCCIMKRCVSNGSHLFRSSNRS